MLCIGKTSERNKYAAAKSDDRNATGIFRSRQAGKPQPEVLLNETMLPAELAGTDAGRAQCNYATSWPLYEHELILP